MFANDTDTLMVASAMATDLPRGRAKAAVTAPTAEAPAKTASAKATDASNTSKQKSSSSSSTNVEKRAGSDDVTESTSFLAGVLERVGHAELFRGGGGGGSNSMGLGNGNDDKGQFASTYMETPSKRARRFSLSTNATKQDGVFPATPTGLSPPLQASPPSTGAVSISSLAQGTSHRMFAGTPGKSLFGENGTLMENDLEAISALNLLGNSPAMLSGSEKRASHAGIATPRKSLFAQVVEGATMASPAPAPLPAVQQRKKRKLHF